MGKPNTKPNDTTPNAATTKPREVVATYSVGVNVLGDLVVIVEATPGTPTATTTALARRLFAALEDGFGEQWCVAGRRARVVVSFSAIAEHERDQYAALVAVDQIDGVKP